jgi:hypothetical protein
MILPHKHHSSSEICFIQVQDQLEWRNHRKSNHMVEQQVSEERLVEDLGKETDPINFDRKHQIQEKRNQKPRTKDRNSPGNLHHRKEEDRGTFPRNQN